jgi:hypothetical protein
MHIPPQYFDIKIGIKLAKYGQKRLVFKRQNYA